MDDEVGVPTYTEIVRTSAAERFDATANLLYHRALYAQTGYRQNIYLKLARTAGRIAERLDPEMDLRGVRA
ncbi:MULTISPECIES: hypothetical protein [Halorussus]|uniref:hypothetical protein n=1 Tax=Halorussus TaxID=1070314 RepID=UPI0020A22778|nr:hypothetical protein [Halorussus vallis]USZ77441.1 hypothetical protein NGM07_08935 [Halorussus vallis]